MNNSVGQFFGKYYKLSIFAYIVILFNVLLQGQNIELYLQLLEEGKRDEVVSNLSNLEIKYPDDPGVLYLRALLELEGEKAVQQYQELIKKYPQSDYADDAGMKIGEYLYARGLYSQASKQFRSIPLHFPETRHLERAIELMVNSYRATGEEDSARYYLRYFGNRFKQLNIHKFGLSPDEDEGRLNLVKVDQSEAKQKIATARKKQKPKKVIVDPTRGKDRPWVVQVGAFSNFTNAKNLKLKLGEAGYSVILDDVMSNGRRLHVVRVIRYSSREEALKVGADLRKRFGVDFRVLKRPE